MKRILALVVLAGLVATGLALFGKTDDPQAMSSFFYSRCRDCHEDDIATCDGCHFHRGVLSAQADQDEYHPGFPVTVTLNGGNAGGWVRAVLYDHNGEEIARVQGPTGTGDDGAGDPVLFPVALAAEAPRVEGDYVWEAAWYGANNIGTEHLEQRVPVTILVRVDTGIDEDVPPPGAGQLWLVASPNPLTSHSTLHCAVGPEISSARLIIVDAAGRTVRSFSGVGLGAGAHRVTWDGTDNSGRPVAAGTYFAILHTRDVQVARPVLVLR